MFAVRRFRGNNVTMNTRLRSNEGTSIYDEESLGFSLPAKSLNWELLYQTGSLQCRQILLRDIPGTKDS